MTAERRMDRAMHELITVTEAAAYMGMRRQSVVAAITAGKLEATRLGRYWYTTQAACDRYQAQKSRRGRPRIKRNRPRLIARRERYAGF
jgi:excisionase family DNA binding protein